MRGRSRLCFCFCFCFPFRFCLNLKIANQKRTEVKQVRAYLLTNAEKHFGQSGPDVYASRVPVVHPRTFLMRRVC